MRYQTRRDAFTDCIEERYAPETDTYCAICGDGIYQDDDIGWNENNQICHAVCMEKEE